MKTVAKALGVIALGHFVVDALLLLGVAVWALV